MRLNLPMVLRASHIYRWQIVDTVRDQSIAEHMYNVWAISYELFGALTDGLGIEELLAVNRRALSDHALTHDLEEVVTGDVPSPMKSALRGTYEFKKVEDEAKAQMGDGFPGPALKGTLAEAVVKLADLIDAYRFLLRYGVECQHKAAVVVELRDKVYKVSKEILSGKFRINGPHPAFTELVEELMSPR